MTECQSGYQMSTEIRHGHRRTLQCFTCIFMYWFRREYFNKFMNILLHLWNSVEDCSTSVKPYGSCYPIGVSHDNTSVDSAMHNAVPVNIVVWQWHMFLFYSCLEWLTSVKSLPYWRIPFQFWLKSVCHIHTACKLNIRMNSISLDIAFNFISSPLGDAIIKYWRRK